MQQAIFYACIIEDDEAGVFVDFIYFGGIANNEEEACAVMESITNDSTLPGAVVPKKYLLNQPLKEIYLKAKKQFKRLSEDIYDMEDMQIRLKTKR